MSDSKTLSPTAVSLVAEFLSEYSESQMATAFRQYGKNLAYHKTQNKSEKLALRKLKAEQEDLFNRLKREAMAELRQQDR
jgi:hypothetical protein